MQELLVGMGRLWAKNDTGKKYIPWSVVFYRLSIELHAVKLSYKYNF